MYALRDGDAALAIAEAHALGLHFSVNHPVSGDPWEHPLDLDFDSIEVWNAVWVAPSSNPKATELWEGILATGRRLAARGGSDVHHQEGIESRILNVGNPTTHIFARERSAAAVIEGFEGRARDDQLRAGGRAHRLHRRRRRRRVCSRPSSAATSTGTGRRSHSVSRSSASARAARTRSR
jgi:hypothetical protein